MIFDKVDKSDDRLPVGRHANPSGMIRQDQLELARKIALETLEEDHQALEVEARSIFR